MRGLWRRTSPPECELGLIVARCPRTVIGRARVLDDPAYPKVPSRPRPRREEGEPDHPADYVDPAHGPVSTPVARGRYGRSMKPGPRAMNDDVIDRP